MSVPSEHAPNISRLSGEVVASYLQDNAVASHTAFDRVAIARVFEKYQLAQPECAWLDTARVARRAWPEFSQRGYGLGNVADTLGIDFRHHDAQEDARAAGEILVCAIQATGISLSAWFDRVKKPISLASWSVRNHCKRRQPGRRAVR